MNPFIVMVDAYRPGNLLAQKIASLNFPLIHLASNKNTPDFFTSTLNRNLFHHCLQFENPSDIKLLQSLNIKNVIAGCETGVQCAQLLNHMLFSNPINHHIQSKSHMLDKLSQSLIRIPLSLKTQNIESAIQFIKKHQLNKWVLKPTNSAGTDQVYIQDNLTDLNEKFNLMLSSQNKLGNKNEFLLIQEFIEGTEYAIDSFSINSKHFITQIWKYHKKKSSQNTMIYDYIELIHPENSLIHYVQNCLNSLEIFNGPAHTEVIVTPSDQIVFIETGFRINGGAHLLRDQLSSSLSQFEVYLQFLSSQKTSILPSIYTQLKNTAAVFLINYHKHVFSTSHIMWNEIKTLPSFLDLSFSVLDQTEINETIDLLTSPGVIHLVHEHKEQILIDIKKIRQLEEHYFHHKA